MKELALKDFLDYQCLSALTASPDKSKCAFVVTHCDEASNGYQSYIYLLDRATRKTTRMTGLGKEKTVCWLNNDTLLFPSMRDAQLQKRVELGEPWTCYYTLSLNGGEAQEYMRIPAAVTKILPIDGDRFAIVADYNIDFPDPHSLPPEERDAYLARKKAMSESYSAADELPFRHNAIGFHNGIRSRLYVYTRSTGEMKPITEPTQNIEFLNVKNGRIIYSARHFRKPEQKRFDQSGMCIYDVDTGVLHDYVAEEPYRMHYCDFMGDLPVFMGAYGDRYGYQENDWFYYIDEAEGKEKCFAENELSTRGAVGTDCRYGGSPEFACDDGHIYYTTTIGGNAHIKRVSLEGQFEQLTAEDGSVDGFALCGDEIIMVAMRGTRLQELYSLKDGVETRLTDFNEWVQTERTLSMPEYLSCVNDGVTIEGYVIKPVGYDPDKKYPGILYIHGGHKLDFGPIFYHELQLYANMGYFVWYCNPRGSDGYDNDFADIIGKYGYDDYSDIMKFTDTCLEKFPQIDPEHIGVGGGSYGGFMTNWVIGHTNRFRCAVSQRGIANFVSMFGTSDTSYRFPVWQFDTTPWMDVARYWDHSPLKYADKCTTPTLFIHAEEDYRCPISEGVQMYYALKYHGCETRICMFKNENHELSRSGKPFNRINRLAEITNWFNSHLK